MHRRIARKLTVVSLVALLAAAALPAQAKSSRPKQHRGKKAIGEIVSFDGATFTLVVDLPGDEDFTGVVDPDVQVKLDHRGWAKKGRGSHGNPTEGSVEDLLPGTAVLRMKVEDELVTKIRIRPTGEAPLPAEGGESVEDHESDGDTAEDSDSDGDAHDDSAEDDDDSDHDSDNDPDDEEEPGDSEDDLPPLPVSQP